jgi:hypothetical protein
MLSRVKQVPERLDIKQKIVEQTTIRSVRAFMFYVKANLT